MPRPGRKSTRHRKGEKTPGFFNLLWKSFWEPPRVTCPKCGNSRVEYYDPFFFSPLRTLKGKRRLKCPECKFVWRSSNRNRSTPWDYFKIRF